MGKVNPHRKKMIEAGMPDKAWQLLLRYYVPNPDRFEGIEVYPDPYVEGAFAVRLTIKSKLTYRKDNEERTIEYVEDMDILWTKGDWEECEYETWPPKANPNDLKFF